MAEKAGRGGRATQMTIYGATGFTGSRIAHQVVRLVLAETGGCKVALGGRNLAKLEAVKRELVVANPELGGRIGSNVSLVVAASDDTDALDAMARATDVVVNAVGPFRRHGLPVVAACVAAGTDYVDVSGEPEFMETVAARFSDAAEASGALVVSACGMDSIPCDLGLLHAAHLAEADGLVPVASELYLTLTSVAGGQLGSVLINYGTWDSLIHSLANVDALRALRAANRLPPLEYADAPAAVFPRRGRLHAAAHVGAAYAVPFMGADASVIRRSQAVRQTVDEKTPIRAAVFFTLPTRFATALFMLWGLLFSLAARFAFSRALLLRFPRIATLGKVSFDGPTPATRAATLLRLNIFLNAVAPDAPRTARPTTYHTRLEMVDPGYDATAACVVQAAATLLHERSSLPAGGVLTPAAAFGASSLLDRLADAPITFSHVSTTLPGPE